VVCAGRQDWCLFADAIMLCERIEFVGVWSNQHSWPFLPYLILPEWVDDIWPRPIVPSTPRVHHVQVFTVSNLRADWTACNVCEILGSRSCYPSWAVEVIDIFSSAQSYREGSSSIFAFVCSRHLRPEESWHPSSATALPSTKGQISRSMAPLCRMEYVELCI